MTGPTPLPAAATRDRAWWIGALLVLALLLAYSNAWQAPFVYDDAPAIPDNPTIRHLWPLGPVLLPHGGGGLTTSGRPILNLSFALNYAISGTAPWSYHLFNVAVHAAAGLLLFGLVRRSSPGRDATLIAAGVSLFWMLHPVQTEAVTYTVQRAESLMGCFYLLTLYAFVRGVTAPAAAGPRTFNGWLLLSVVACALGMATKEVMATAPLVVLLYDRTFVARSFVAAWRLRRRYYVAHAGTWLLLSALVASTGGNRGGTVGFGVGVPWWAYALTQFQALTTYLRVALWPAPLVFEYGTFWVSRAREVLPYMAVIVPLLAVSVVALFSPRAAFRRAGFAGAVFFLVLAPTSLAPGTIQMIVEHRMYVSLAALVALLGGSFYRAVGARGLVTLVAAAPALVVLTFARNRDYRSHLALWTDTVAKRPNNARAYQSLAEAYAETGREPQALAAYAMSVQLQPMEPTFHYNLGLALAKAGQLREAIVHYEVALRLNPKDAGVHNNLGVALVRIGDPAKAVEHYQAAIQLEPKAAQFHYNLGIAWLRLGRPADAQAAFENVLQLQADNADAEFNLASALALQGRFDDAMRQFHAALQLRPNDDEYHTAFANTLLAAGNGPAALTEFQTILQHNSNAVEARYGLAATFTAMGRIGDATAVYEELLRVAPNHANGHFKLGNLLLDQGRLNDAVPHYVAALRLQPNDAEAHHNLGVAYARLERYREAETEFEAAVRAKPDYAEARQHLEQTRQLLAR
jgi:tetratricopeptide (TPR) repeat protein